MSSLAFDTHAYVKKLKAVGFTEQQAEAQAEALSEIIVGNLATKPDIADLQRDISDVKSELQRDIKELEVTLKRDISELGLRLKHDLTLRLGGIVVAGMGVVTAIVKLF